MKHDPLEKDIEKKIGDYAKKHGCLYWKLVSPATRGVPDRMICTNRGVVGFLEVKRRGGKPTDLQLLKMKELSDRGHQVTWCDSVEAGCKFVDDLIRAAEWIEIAKAVDSSQEI